MKTVSQAWPPGLSGPWDCGSLTGRATFCSRTFHSNGTIQRKSLKYSHPPLKIVAPVEIVRYIPPKSIDLRAYLGTQKPTVTRFNNARTAHPKSLWARFSIYNGKHGISVGQIWRKDLNGRYLNGRYLILSGGWEHLRLLVYGKRNNSAIGCW